MDITDNKKLSFNGDVIILKDTLFLHQRNKGQRQFQVLMGEEIIKPELIDIFQSNISYNQSIAKREGFDYKHIVFPCKPILYKEQFEDIGINLTPIFSNRHVHPSVFYPKLSITDYFLSDTHINVIGTLKLINNILLDFGYSSLPRPILENKNFIGDLGKMIGKNNGEEVETIKGFHGLPIESIDMYSLYPSLKSNAGQVIFRFNPNAIHNRRLVLFGTSSFSDRIDVYQYVFSEVIFFRSSYILDDVVRTLEPDIVLTGNAERHLYNVPNANKSKPWFLNYISNKYDSKLVTERAREAFTALFSGRESKEYIDMFGSRLSDCSTE